MDELDDDEFEPVGLFGTELYDRDGFYWQAGVLSARSLADCRQPARRRLGRKIVPTDPVMPFGKHKGKRLDQVPPDYLAWLVQQDMADAELREAIRKFISV